MYVHNFYCSAIQIQILVEPHQSIPFAGSINSTHYNEDISCKTIGKYDARFVGKYSFKDGT